MASGLFLVVKEGEAGRTFSLQEAHTSLAAQLRARLAGQEGNLIECTEVKAKKLPKDFVGRVLSQKEAMRLLKKLG